MDRIAQLKPDLVTLDVEMPDMNGLDVLQSVNKRALDVGVIMISSPGQQSRENTVRALELGAFDFLLKPDGGSMETSKAAIERGLGAMVKAYGHRREIQTRLRGGGISMPSVQASVAVPRTVHKTDGVTMTARPEMVLIGVSTGGPDALTKVLPQLPEDMGVPVFIVQHMPPLFTQSLAASLDAKCAIKVKEAGDRETACANTAYIAPGGKQMKIIRGMDGSKVIVTTDDPPENNCRPSVDYLFRSAAAAFPGLSTAVIMTGMGSDGTMGLKALKDRGCYSIAQDEPSCVVFGMPKGAIEAGVVDLVVPLESIAREICRSLKRHAVC